MPDNKYRNSHYNPLGASEEDDLSIQSETQGFHEIRVYNGVRDLIWSLFSNLILSNNIDEVLVYAEQIQVTLLRADSVWKGIQSSANIKSAKLKLGTTKSFEYKGEMKVDANRVKRYVDFYTNYTKFIDKYGNYDEEFKTFMNNTEEGKLSEFKNKIEEIVSSVDNTWGELASKLGMGMPLKIAEEREMFFRGH